MGSRSSAGEACPEDLPVFLSLSFSQKVTKAMESRLI